MLKTRHSISCKRPFFRILILEDNDEYIDIYKTVFEKEQNFPSNYRFNVTNEDVGCINTYRSSFAFDVTICNRREEAIFHIQKSLTDHKPFSLVFLDIRCEDDFDGFWVAEKIRQLDPNIEIVMVAENMGCSIQEIIDRVPPADKIVYLTKPVTNTQIIHFTYSSVYKWLNEHNFLELLEFLEKTVQDRTMDLEVKNRLLNEQLSKCQKAEAALKQKLIKQTTLIEEKDIALEVLLDKRNKDKIKFGEMIVANARTLLLPTIEKMKSISSVSNLQAHVKVLEMNVNEIVSPFIAKLSLGQYDLTYMETQVAHYVKIGRSNKEIADILCVGIGTVLTHRHNLRKKLGITNRKKNLRAHLISLE